LTGAQGPVGAQGIIGPKGEIGPKGDIGPVVGLHFIFLIITESCIYSILG